jgi:hypothetical protein
LSLGSLGSLDGDLAHSGTESSSSALSSTLSSTGGDGAAFLVFSASSLTFLDLSASSSASGFAFLVFSASSESLARSLTSLDSSTGSSAFNSTGGDLSASLVFSA